MATEVRWRDGVTGNWFVAGNWTTGTVPATGDTAIIESGTAIISSASAPSIVGEAIVLGGADDGSTVTLQTTDARFEGSGSGASEVNATLTVTGDVGTTHAFFIAQGDTSFDGQIFVEPVGGSFTIVSQSDGSDPGMFTLLNTDSKATIVVSQESFLDFEGQTFVNHALIQIEGGAEISAGVTFTGNDGVFLLENGGQLSIEGAVGDGQQIVFLDGTGKLTIENLADFEGIIGYAELPTAPGEPALGVAGGRIDLPNVQAQSVAYASGNGDTGTLFLYAGPNQTGGVVAELTMRMVTDKLEPAPSTLSSVDFALSVDGNGGTLITYSPQGATYLLASLPTPVIAEPGDIVSLTSMLVDSFGTPDTPFEGVWLFPSQPFDNTATNVGYWGSPNVTPEWYIGDQKVEKATFVTDISNVTLHAGNQIDNPASFQVRVTEDASGPGAEFITYNVWTVDPAIQEAIRGPGYVPAAAPTPENIVAAAKAFAAVYGDGVIANTNLCNWIADNVAAGAGAPMPLPNTSFDPSLNVEGGFWRIAYDSSGPVPVQDWSTLIQPGDIVRMGWFNPEAGRVSGHSTTVLAVNTDGVVQFYDNNDAKHIGIHDAEYWLNTNPSDITIYRLDPDQQYLIQGTGLSETIHGSVYNNLIRPGGGADTITAGAGDNEIEDIAAHLNGIAVTDFNLGDSFHFTDLDPQRTFTTYYGGELHVFEGFKEVATIDVSRPAAGLSFLVTSDADGGATIELAPRHDVIESAVDKFIYWIDNLIDRFLSRVFDHFDRGDAAVVATASIHADLAFTDAVTSGVQHYVDALHTDLVPLLGDLGQSLPQLSGDHVNPAGKIADYFHHHDIWN